jgi:hypothetical protein
LIQNEMELSNPREGKIADISKIARLSGAVSGVMTGHASGVGAAYGAAQAAIGNNFEVTLNNHWQGAWQALRTRGNMGLGAVGVGAVGVGAVATLSGPALFVGSAVALSYALHKISEDVEGGESAEQSQGNRPQNLAPEGSGRSGAFNKAKEASGIPKTQQPDEVLPNIDRRGKSQPGRRYIFNKGKPNETVIRDDAGGHNFGPSDPQNRGPHFNDPKGNHYDY